MSQVSKKFVDKKVYARMFGILVSSLISINNQQKAEKFIGDLFTDTEKVMLAKRLSIAFLLMKNYTYENIGDLLKVSKSTIWQVQRWLSAKGEGYKVILNELIKKDSKQTTGFFDLLEEILPPPRGTNWSEERRRMYARRREKEKPF